MFRSEPRKLNNPPSERGVPFSLCIYSQKSLPAHSHRGRAVKTQPCRSAPATGEGGTKGRMAERQSCRRAPSAGPAEQRLPSGRPLPREPFV